MQMRCNRIIWGSGNGFNFGRIPDTKHRVERMRIPPNSNWKFMLSTDKLLYYYVSPIEYATVEEMEQAAFNVIYGS